MRAAIPIASLHLADEIGDGGQGRVFLLDGEPNLVFKRYHAAGTGVLRADVLTELVNIAGSLSTSNSPVTEWAAWPERVVVDQGEVIGFVMPRASSAFVRIIGGRPRLADLSYLAKDPPPIWGPVSLPDVVTRIRILRALARAMATLHARGLVIGDLSFGNVLWRTDPTPGVFLLDCDGVHHEGGPSTMPQADTLDWHDPHAQAGAAPDRDRDSFKLALAIARVVTRSLSCSLAEASSSSLDLPANLRQTVQDALHRADGPPGTRPTAQEWVTILGGRASITVQPPVPRGPSGPDPKPHLLAPDKPPRAYRSVSPPNADHPS